VARKKRKKKKCLCQLVLLPRRLEHRYSDAQAATTNIFRKGVAARRRFIGTARRAEEGYKQKRVKEEGENVTRNTQ